MLKLENIIAGYTVGSEILKGVNLELGAGEVLGIIGLNGCGKSTLGKTVMNAIPFRSGNVYFRGKEIGGPGALDIQSSGIKMVMQGGRVFAHMTVWEHFKLAANGCSEKEIWLRLQEMAVDYGLHIFPNELREQHKGGNLSGGQRQLLALALALFSAPSVLVLDELSAGLSPIKLQQLVEVLKELKKSAKVSILLIEQNVKMAALLSDRLLKMERGVIAQEYILDDQFDMNQLKQIFFT